MLRADRAGPDHVKVHRRKQLVVRRAQRLIKAGPSEVQSAMTPRKQFSTAGRPRQGQLPVATLSYEASGLSIKANGHFIKANGRFIKAMAVLSRGAFGGLQGQVRV